MNFTNIVIKIVFRKFTISDQLVLQSFYKIQRAKPLLFILSRAVVAQWITCWIFSQTEKISFGVPGSSPAAVRKFSKELFGL